MRACVRRRPAAGGAAIKSQAHLRYTPTRSRIHLSPISDAWSDLSRHVLSQTAPVPRLPGFCVRTGGLATSDTNAASVTPRPLWRPTDRLGDSRFLSKMPVRPTALAFRPVSNLCLALTPFFLRSRSTPVMARPRLSTDS